MAFILSTCVKRLWLRCNEPSCTSQLHSRQTTVRIMASVCMHLPVLLSIHISVSLLPMYLSAYCCRYLECVQSCMHGYACNHACMGTRAIMHAWVRVQAHIRIFANYMRLAGSGGHVVDLFSWEQLLLCYRNTASLLLQVLMAVAPCGTMALILLLVLLEW
jgi:hypothetical protein